MSTAELKSKLHYIIDSINDLSILRAVYTILAKSSGKEGDWSDSLSEKEYKLIEKGLQELNEGKGIPYDEVRKKVDQFLSQYEG